MLGRPLERWAARSQPRFEAFVAGKDAYLDFMARMDVSFDRMSVEHYARARVDPRLELATRHFTAAIEMSEREGEWGDVSVALGELGMVRHATGDLVAAGELMRRALTLLETLPLGDRTEAMSRCHYHLGVIALKQGRLSEAVADLRRSRELDEAIADLSGVQLCDRALAACAEAGTDVEGAAPFSRGEGDWDAPPHASPSLSAEETDKNGSEESRTFRASRRELLWLVSYSVEANDALMAQLEALEEEFGRPVEVTRAALGASDPARRVLPRPDPDQHVCAALLVTERAGLQDRGFRTLVDSCIHRVLKMPDFRLILYLEDLTIDDLREQASGDRLVATLFETTQIMVRPSPAELRRTLVSFVRDVEWVYAREIWRRLRLCLAVAAGLAARSVLVAAASLVVVGGLLWLAGSGLPAPGGLPGKASAVLLGLLAFPMQSPLIYLLVRGPRTVVLAPRDSPSLVRWVLVGMMVMIAASHLHHVLEGRVSWVLLGIALGILLDAIQRAGRRARRATIDLMDLLRRVGSPDLADPTETVHRSDPLNAFACPLLPGRSARVFISYTHRSAKATRFAAALYGALQAAGASPFLDRASIPVGTSWRRVLDHQIGDCDVFVCILDEESVQSEWVGAEVLAALDAHRYASTPHVVLLADPAISQRQPPAMLPLFRGILAAADATPMPGRPMTLRLNEYTCRVIKNENILQQNC